MNEKPLQPKFSVENFKVDPVLTWLYTVQNLTAFHAKVQAAGHEDRAKGLQTVTHNALSIVLLQLKCVFQCFPGSLVHGPGSPGEKQKNQKNMQNHTFCKSSVFYTIF